MFKASALNWFSNFTIALFPDYVKFFIILPCFSVLFIIVLYHFIQRKKKSLFLLY